MGLEIQRVFVGQQTAETVGDGLAGLGVDTDINLHGPFLLGCDLAGAADELREELDESRRYGPNTDPPTAGFWVGPL
jgi:hypothetical protein